MEDWYSVRMRASKGAAHEDGGLHISGAERLVESADIEKVSNEMIWRAMNHSRGRTDFISIKIETIQANDIETISPLPVTQMINNSHHTTIDILQKQLAASPIGKDILSAAYEWMINDHVTRGAIVVDINSGERVDLHKGRGVRVSRFDWDKQYVQKWSKALLGTYSERRAEAIALASKVAAAGTICELCCSDDPEYTTGYVTYKGKYIQIPNMKQKDSLAGGRVFFIDSSRLDLKTYINYLEKVPVLVGGII